MTKTILVISAIILVAVVMGFGVIAPAIADHGAQDPECLSVDEVFDPNTGVCILAVDCPFGISTDPQPHCTLAPGPPVDPGPPADPGPPEGIPGNPREPVQHLNDHSGCSVGSLCRAQPDSCSPPRDGTLLFVDIDGDNEHDHGVEPTLCRSLS